MKKQNNIYNYSIPKSGNEETSYFFTKGRITIYSFLLRLLFCVLIYSLSYFIFSYFSDKYWSVYDIDAAVPVTDEKTITLYTVSNTLHFYIVPVLLIIFVLIQGAKRMHDINKSGWYFLIPVYNIYLAILKGTIGSNNYGIDPKPSPRVEYFDELEINKAPDSNLTSSENLNNNRSFVIIFILILVFLFIVFIKVSEEEVPIVVIKDTTAVIKPENRTKIKNKYKKPIEEDLSEDLDYQAIDTTISLMEKTYNPEELPEPLDKDYLVIASERYPVYFYNTPNLNDRKNTFFNTNESVRADFIKNNFIYIEFTNSEGQLSKGWIHLSDCKALNE